MCLVAVPLRAQDLTEGLVGYYSFCGCNANDHSGNDNHGLLMGNPACIEGIKGEGFFFNESGGSMGGCSLNNTDFIILPAFDAIWEEGFTVCAWVEFKHLVYFERIVDLGGGSGEAGGMPIWFGREGNSNNLTLESWISTDGTQNRTVGRLVAEDAITNGQIEFYCATISGNTMRIYVNGNQVAQKNGNPILNVPRDENYIGRSNWCESDPDFHGFMDEVRIYNRALSAEEITRMYESPFISTTEPDGICLGDSLQLQAQGGIAYAWSPTAGLSATDIANPVATPSATTDYYCEILFPDGCALIDTFRVQVHHDTTTMVEKVICEGESYAGRTTSGVYTDYLTTQYGCDSTRILDLQVLPAPKRTEARTICRGAAYYGQSATGRYQLSLPAEEGCDTLLTLDLAVVGPILENLSLTPSSCGLADGSIAFDIQGAAGAITTRLNGRRFADATKISGLSPGMYELTVADTLGCRVDTTLTLSSAECPVFVPNAFSPNDDGRNDTFRLYAWIGVDATVRSYRIFDRWGALVYEALDFPLHGSGRWWDGTFAGEPVTPGNYVYVVDVNMGNGRTLHLSGEVLLLP